MTARRTLGGAPRGGLTLTSPSAAAATTETPAEVAAATAGRLPPSG